MPYIRPRGALFAVCPDFRPGAFYVSDTVWQTWEWLCQQAGHGQPRNRHNLPLRPYPAGVYNGDPVNEGIFVDWQHDVTRQFIFTARRTAVVDQPTHRWLATTFGPFQHSLQSYRAADCWARRVDRGQARGGQARDPQAADYRRWSNRRWSTTAAAANQSNGHRCFGVELEFNHPTGQYGSISQFHHDIAGQARLAGLAIFEAWDVYGTASASRRNGGRRPVGWLGTADSTVTGGEIISDLLAGDDDSLAEVRTMLNIIRDVGGVPAERQGIHVSHDVRDFTADDKLRLVDNLRALAPLLADYLPQSRRNGYWCHQMDSADWARERRSVAAGRNGSGSHNQSFNFGHLFEGPTSRVEFRQFGHSLNSAKLRCWIRVGQAIMSATRNGVIFDATVTTATMLDTLRQHGLSEAAADRWADTVARRSNGLPVAV